MNHCRNMFWRRLTTILIIILIVTMLTLVYNHSKDYVIFGQPAVQQTYRPISLYYDYEPPSQTYEIASEEPSEIASEEPSEIASEEPLVSSNKSDFIFKVFPPQNGNTLWAKSCRSRRQDYHGKLTKPMKVIIAGTKGKHIRLNPGSKLGQEISSIRKREGIAPTQQELKSFITNKCEQFGLTNGTRPRLAYYNTEHKIVYIANPKCGSTSFKKFLLRLAGDTRPYNEMLNVHNEDDNPLLRNLWDESSGFQEMALRDYYVITFVRNPLVRLVSGYRNKIVRVPKFHYIDTNKAIIEQNYGKKYSELWKPGKTFRPSFEQFVEYLLYTGEIIGNAHWAPYADPIGLCTISYDMIGQLETAHQHIAEMKEDVPSLKDVAFPISRIELGVDEFSSADLTAMAFSNLTDELINGVYDFYKKELLLLGYSLIGKDNFPFIQLANVYESRKTE